MFHKGLNDFPRTTPEAGGKAFQEKNQTNNQPKHLFEHPKQTSINGGEVINATKRWSGGGVGGLVQLVRMELHNQMSDRLDPHSW